MAHIWKVTMNSGSFLIGTIIRDLGLANQQATSTALQQGRTGPIGTPEYIGPIAI
jgi:hypothetical protein